MKEFVDAHIEFLEKAQLSVKGRLVDASNATLFAQAESELESRKVIYKPEAGERPLWDFVSGSLAKREYAAFRFSYLMQDFIVPPTILRDGPYGPGMVQLWIEIDEEIDLMNYFQVDNPQLRRLALFDAVINNTDRKIGHLLPDRQGRLFACDHGVTFHEDDKLRTVLWQWAGVSLSEAEIAWLDRAQVVARDPIFLELLEPGEVHALMERVLRLRQELVFPSPSEEWPAVPWPPF